MDNSKSVSLLEKRMKRFNLSSTPQISTSKSILQELVEQQNKPKHEWSNQLKYFFLSLKFSGGNKTLNLISASGIEIPSMSTLSRTKYWKYLQFGILEAAFVEAKKFYDSIKYSGSFSI